MEKLIKSFLPEALLKYYRKRKREKLSKKSSKDVFTDIYKSNHWNSDESISGIGSQLNQTKTLITALNQLINNSAYTIKTVLDIPCGDFNWMQHVDLSKVKYIGADIVEPLITQNKQQFNLENVSFEVLNLLIDDLPKSDLVFVRDCLVHLSFKDIMQAIQNIKKSNSKYLLTTTFTNHKINKDIVTGEWRALNLQLPPFNFTDPLLTINENCTEGNLQDKCMVLYEIKNLP